MRDVQGYNRRECDAKMGEYQIVLDHTRGERELPLNKEVVVKQLRDKNTMFTFRAKVIVRSSFDEYPHADKLYYVSPTRGERKEPVPIEIIERLEEAIREVRVLPKTKLTLGERKGRMLATMLKERQEKTKK